MSFSGISKDVEAKLQAGSHVMRENDRELMLDEVRKDERAREAGARQRHKEQQALERADALLTPELMERYREAYRATFERVTREGRARQTSSQALPMKKACPVPLHVHQATSLAQAWSQADEDRLRKASQELIPLGYSPEEAGAIFDEVKQLLRPDEIAMIMNAH